MFFCTVPKNQQRCFAKIIKMRIFADFIANGLDRIPENKFAIWEDPP